MPDLFDDEEAGGPERLRPLAKSADAFRTISEVAQELEVPQHVLRFWESRFPQVKPLKRAGGRRYYRPDDVVLLRRIRQCLYDQGYTIKGVQKLLREGAFKADIPQQRPAGPVATASVAPPSQPRGRDTGGRVLLLELRHELAELRELLQKRR